MSHFTTCKLQREFARRVMAVEKLKTAQRTLQSLVLIFSSPKLAK